jgi:FSR family fosmidomycin resistance protein-like MFS transporter
MDSSGESPSQRAALGAACALGLAHALVDATTVALLVWGTKAPAATATIEGAVAMPEHAVWSRYLLYDVLAFGTQFSLGAVADRWKAYRGTLLTGLAMIGVAVGMEAFSPAVAVIVASLGNACFHVGAGALVLVKSPRRTVPLGVFVGPGAIGLATGLYCGASLDFGPWALLGPLAACVAAAWGMRDTGETARPPLPRLVLGRLTIAVCVCAILLVTVVRSVNGNSVSVANQGHGSVLWGLAIAACAGNVLGGFVADRAGWIGTCLLAIVLSAPLLSFCGGFAPACIVGVLLFQMTMPVTLTAVWRMFPGEAGLAFGLAALAVLVGALPIFVCPAEWVTSRGLLLFLAVVSIPAVLVGLLPIVWRERVAP